MEPSALATSQGGRFKGRIAGPVVERSFFDIFDVGARASRELTLWRVLHG